ncbi:MAG TPA: phosphatidate cytidylyltransferase [Longimicrobiales bacterium]|nr:phosphatidate cytidylyltransferase [Longimicrobiales bacterium]
MASELGKRVAVAAVGIPLALIIIYLGGWPFTILLAIIAGIGAAEFYRLAAQRGVHAFVALGAALAAGAVILATVADDAAVTAAWSWRMFVAAALLVGPLAIFRRGVARAPLGATAVTIFGALFTGGTLAYAVFLRELNVPALDTAHARWVGPALVTFPLVMTWLSDTSAYFGGRTMGRRKLMPSVSPGKTVEGAVAGVIGTVLTGALYAHFVLGAWLGLPVTALFGALAGLIVSPVAQVGDLAESLLKREAGVKDSGTLLPGHGGVLDRFDSLFFSIPVTYWLLLLVL